MSVFLAGLRYGDSPSARTFWKVIDEEELENVYRPNRAVRLSYLQEVGSVAEGSSIAERWELREAHADRLESADSFGWIPRRRPRS